MDFPSTVPLPAQSPVAMAVFPNTATFTLLIWFFSHFAVLIVARVSFLPVTLPSESVLMNLSARRGASMSGSLALAASIHFCSSPATACSVPPPISSFACAATINDSNATTDHTNNFFMVFCCSIRHARFVKAAKSYATGMGNAIWLDLLQSLHVVHAGNLPHTVDDLLQMFQVGDVEHHVDAGLAVVAAGFHAADVGFGIADHGRDLLQHAEAIVAEQRELYRIGNGMPVFIFVAGPPHVDPPDGLAEKIGDVRTVDGVDSHSFAAGDIADYGLPANRVATLGSIHQQVALSADDDGVAVSTKNPAHRAGKALGCGLRLVVRHGLSAGRREFRQHLPRGVLAIADAGHQVVGTAESVFAGRPLQIRFLDFLERDAVFARLFFNQLFADFNGALALVDVKPVLDLVAGTRRLDHGQRVAAGLVSGLGDDFDDVAGVKLVAKRDHASVDFRPGATVPDLGVNRVGEIDGRRLARQHQNLALRRKGVDLFRVEVDFQRGEELVGIGDVALPFPHLPQPGQALFVFGGDGAVFVFPVRGDAFFAHLVHFIGANLDFKSLARLGDHRSVQRLVEIRPRHGDDA